MVQLGIVARAPSAFVSGALRRETPSAHRLLVALTARPGSDESRSRCPGLSLSHRLPTCGCGSLMACVVPVTAGSEWLKKGIALLVAAVPSRPVQLDRIGRGSGWQ